MPSALGSDSIVGLGVGVLSAVGVDRTIGVMNGMGLRSISRGSLRPCIGQLSPTQIFGVLEGMLAALDELQAHGNRFLVAGRLDDDGLFHELPELTLPPGYEALFEAIPEFRDGNTILLRVRARPLREPRAPARRDSPTRSDCAYAAWRCCPSGPW